MKKGLRLLKLRSFRAPDAVARDSLMKKRLRLAANASRPASAVARDSLMKKGLRRKPQG